MDGSLGSGCSLASSRGYLLTCVSGQAVTRPESQVACAASTLARDSPPRSFSSHLPCVAWISFGSLVGSPPPSSTLLCQQLVFASALAAETSPMSPLDGFPTPPFFANVVPSTSLANGSNTHSWCPSTSALTPPRHSSSGNSLSTCGGGFSSTPGYGTSRIPHALLPEKVSSTTRSLRPPASVIPVPSSPGALDDLGDAALLLLTMRLWII